MDLLSTPTKFLKKFGITLRLNPDPSKVRIGDYIVDVETDEKDNFVGLALYNGGEEVYYYSWMSDSLRELLANLSLSGHNLKGDAHWLKKWGVDINSEALKDDTMLQSYVISSTKETHHLKDLAKEYLGMNWASYKTMVHPDVDHPKKKITLDKQDVEVVADYCGSDAVATWRLVQYFNRVMTPTQKRIYNVIEMPLMRLLYDMEEKGINIDVEHLKNLDKQYTTDIQYLLTQIGEYTQGGININSPIQLLKFFASLGIKIPNTKKDTLMGIKNCEFAYLLLAYKRKNKLHSTYIKPFLDLATLPKIKCEFNQVTHDSGDKNFVGISTGRLSCRKPNLQNIPSHGDDGKQIRKLFIPKAGYSLIVADYSQIEYRLLAHFSKEPRLLEAFRNGKDVHTETSLALGVDRGTGKTLNFAAIYGAGSKKIAATAKVTEQEAGKFLDSYWKVLPKVQQWINRVKYEAKAQKGIYTLNRRFIPLPKINSADMYERFHWERAAVNYQIQGSAAEVIKIAMLACSKSSYYPLLTIHDELLFEVHDKHPSEFLDGVTDDIQAIMENVIKLDVPLIVNMGIGENWNDAKQY